MLPAQDLTPLRVMVPAYITNSSIRSRTKQPQLTAVIRKRRLLWFGHLQRMNIDRIPNPASSTSCTTGNHPTEKKAWPTIMVRGHPERHQQNGPGWTVKRWRLQKESGLCGGISLVRASQAVSAVMHDAVQ